MVTLGLYTPWSGAPSIHYSEFDDNGVTWKGDHPSDSLKNSRSSFALIEDSYANRSTFYIVKAYKPARQSSVKEGSLKEGH